MSRSSSKSGSPPKIKSNAVSERNTSQHTHDFDFLFLRRSKPECNIGDREACGDGRASKF